VGERRFSAGVVVRRAPEDVFEWVADYRNAPRALEGVTGWKPLGRQTRGVGARFDVEMRAFGFPLRNVLVLDEWNDPSAIGWHSESGPIAQRGGWTFGHSPAGTEVRLTIGYEPPAGVVGGIVAGGIERLVQDRLQRALDRLRVTLEEETGPLQNA
jgi:uncharacterized membrane protein